MAHLNIEAMWGTAGGFGGSLWGIDGAPALSALFFKLSNHANQTHHELANYRAFFNKQGAIPWR